MRVLVFAGDLRQKYLAGHLEKMKYEVKLLSDKERGNKEQSCMKDLEILVRECDVLVLPTPSFSQDAMIRGSVFSFDELQSVLHPGQMVFGSIIGKERTGILEQKGVKVYDMMASEEVAVRNAVATAEGAIAEAISLTSSNLHDMNALVIGYGRCGSVLAEKLKGLCREVCVTARRKEVRTEAEAMGFRAELLCDCSWERYGIIFNTVPAPVIGEERVAELKKGCVIIDLASAPGGVDYEACQKAGIRAKLCGGLPGVYAPETSGIILAEEIERSIICRK